MSDDRARNKFTRAYEFVLIWLYIDIMLYQTFPFIILIWLIVAVTYLLFSHKGEESARDN